MSNMAEFTKGTKVKLTNGDSVTVMSTLGEGGQGTVYKVDYNGKQYAMKWYLPNFIKSLKPNYKRFYKNLVDNVQSGSPSQHFLWMKAVAATGKHSNGFGYLMELRPTNYSEFTKFIKAKEHFASTRAVINAAINIVDGFHALHRRGYSYQDLSPGNFFIDKNSGNVLICDNDNVAPNGQNLGVGGTPGYMAPEVVLGTSKPNTDTDLFSLAVILFELFFLAHPLEGQKCCQHPCLTRQLEKELYAIHPVFVCSKTDTSNGPVRGTCSNLMNLWPAYPQYLQETFQRAFSEEALKNSTRRLTEKDWKTVLFRLLDDAVDCPKCGEINFASMAQGNKICCTVCKNHYILPTSVQVNGHTIFAGKNKTLTEHHTAYGQHDVVIGTFLESKKTAGVFGLRNETSQIWSVEYPNIEPRTCEHGKVVTLVPDTQIHIGDKIISVIAPNKN